MSRSRAASGRPVPVLAAVAAVLGLPVGAGAIAHAAAPRPASARVVLRDVAFNPATTRIRQGGRVTWSWEDPYVMHNVHSVGTRRFRGASSRGKGTYTVRFARKGTYRYTCTLHPGMNGAVVVG